VTYNKILITGVAGFIGSNLAERLLREGHVVIGLDNLAYGVREQIPDGVEFHHDDIRDRGIGGVFKGIDAVFHLAAKNCISDCQNDPVETADINVTGTVNVFEMSRRAGVRKVIYAESSALYEGSDTYPTPEEDVKAQSFYSVSKLAERDFAEAYARYFSLNSTALRYFCVYGPRQDYRRTVPPVMSAFILKLLAGERPIIYGTGEKKRDFVFVDDVNDFHLLCLRDTRTDGQTYNVGSGTRYSVREIYEQIASLLGSHVEPEFKPDLPGEAETTLADISKAVALGWRPKTSLEDGLQQSIAYIRQHVISQSAPSSAAQQAPAR